MATGSKCSNNGWKSTNLKLSFCPPEVTALKNVWGPCGHCCDKKSTWKIRLLLLTQSIWVAPRQKHRLITMLYKREANRFRRIITTEVRGQKQNKKTHSSQPITAWWQGHGRTRRTCVERYCKLAGKSVSALKRAGTPCMDVLQFTPEGFGVVPEKCYQFGVILQLNVFFVPEVGDLTNSGRSTCWHDLSPSGTKLVAIS